MDKKKLKLAVHVGDIARNPRGDLVFVHHRVGRPAPNMYLVTNLHTGSEAYVSSRYLTKVKGTTNLRGSAKDALDFNRLKYDILAGRDFKTKEVSLFNQMFFSAENSSERETVLKFLEGIKNSNPG